jgi:hypothetical protein
MLHRVNPVAARLPGGGSYVASVANRTTWREVIQTLL